MCIMQSAISACGRAAILRYAKNRMIDGHFVEQWTTSSISPGTSCRNLVDERNNFAFLSFTGAGNERNEVCAKSNLCR